METPVLDPFPQSADADPHVIGERVFSFYQPEARIGLGTKEAWKSRM